MYVLSFCESEVWAWLRVSGKAVAETFPRAAAILGSVREGSTSNFTHVTLGVLGLLGVIWRHWFSATWASPRDSSPYGS